MADPALLIERPDDTSFVATLDGVEVGWASIALGDGEWEVYRTSTAHGYQGRGIASRLTRVVLDAADEAGVRVIPSCWFVDGLMRRSSPTYDHLRTSRRIPQVGADDACPIGPMVLPPGRSA